VGISLGVNVGCSGMAVGTTGGVAVAYSTAYRAVMVRFGVTSIAGNAFRTNGNGIEQAITTPASSSKTTILEKDLVLTFTSNQEKIPCACRKPAIHGKLSESVESFTCVFTGPHERPQHSPALTRTG
jgi:hypothetical protein